MDIEKFLVDGFKSLGEKIDDTRKEIANFRSDTNGRLSKLETRMDNFKEELDERTTISNVEIKVKEAIQEHLKSCPHKNASFSIAPDTRKWLIKVVLIGTGLGLGVGVPELLKLIGAL